MFFKDIDDYLPSLTDILNKAVEMRASDVLLRPNLFIMYKIGGTWYRFSEEPILDLAPYLLELDNIMGFGNSSLGERGGSQIGDTLKEERDLDLSFALPTGQRFRVNLSLTASGPMFVARIIRSEEPPLESLGFKPESIRAIEEALMRKRGLILVTGVTGSGKSTTLAAMIGWLNDQYALNIVTIEHPIEFVFVSKRSIIHQREVGIHTENFASALRSAMRQAPDVIMVGEMRDPETIKAALTAAETGHLVLSTLHTRSAPETILRIVDALPPEDKPLARQQLAGSISLAISQKLVPSTKGGLVLAYELIFPNDAIRFAVTKDEPAFINDIRNQIRSGKEKGMFLMEQILAEHVVSGMVLPEVAEVNANYPEELRILLQGKSISLPSPTGNEPLRLFRKGGEGGGD